MSILADIINPLNWGGLTRGLLAGKPGEQVSSQELFGLGDEGIGSTLGGIGLDMLTDPMGLLGGALIGKLGKGGLGRFIGSEVGRGAPAAVPGVEQAAAKLFAKNQAEKALLSSGATTKPAANAVATLAKTATEDSAQDWIRREASRRILSGESAAAPVAKAMKSNVRPSYLGGPDESWRLLHPDIPISMATDMNLPATAAAAKSSSLPNLMRPGGAMLGMSPLILALLGQES